MTFRGTQSNLILAPSKAIWRISSASHNDQNCISSPAVHIYIINLRSTQPGLESDQHKNETEQPFEVPERLPSRSELHVLFENELNHIGITLMKEVVMRGIKKLLAEHFELDFQAANTEIKSAFFSFLKVALMDMIHKAILISILM